MLNTSGLNGEKYLSLKPPFQRATFLSVSRPFPIICASMVPQILSQCLWCLKPPSFFGCFYVCLGSLWSLCLPLSISDFFFFCEFVALFLASLPGYVCVLHIGWRGSRWSGRAEWRWRHWFVNYIWGDSWPGRFLPVYSRQRHSSSRQCRRTAHRALWVTSCTILV